jgi:hypothetical protein
MTDPTPDKALAAARAVLIELAGRKGFDYWWEDIDRNVRREIRDALAERIRRAYR